MEKGTSEYEQSTSGKAIKGSDAKKKASRPTKPKNKAIRSWTDDEINVLVEALDKHKNLYNTKHKTCKSSTSMENTLKNNCYCKANLEKSQ